MVVGLRCYNTVDPNGSSSPLEGWEQRSEKASDLTLSIVPTKIPLSGFSTSIRKRKMHAPHLRLRAVQSVIMKSSYRVQR